MQKWIIDTNIVVHWIMSNHLFGLLIPHFRLSEDFRDIYQRHTNESSVFIDAAGKMNNKIHNFFITELSLNEMFSAIRDEIRTIMLFLSGVPMSKWSSKRESKEAAIPNDLPEQIYHKTLEGLDVLITKKKIKIVDTMTASVEPNYLDVYSSLLFFIPYLKTQDAMLISTAIFEEASYFVTTDKDIIKISKNTESKYGLKIVSPKDAHRILTG